MAAQCARRVVAVGWGVLHLPVDLNQFGHMDSREWSPAGQPGMQQQELHSTTEQYRAAQWAGSINEIDEPFPHFKVAEYLSNNLVKWQVLANKHARRTDAAELWATLKS